MLPPGCHCGLIMESGPCMSSMNALAQPPPWPPGHGLQHSVTRARHLCHPQTPLHRGGVPRSPQRSNSRPLVLRPTSPHCHSCLPQIHHQVSSPWNSALYSRSFTSASSLRHVRRACGKLHTCLWNAARGVLTFVPRLAPSPSRLPGSTGCHRSPCLPRLHHGDPETRGGYPKERFRDTLTHTERKHHTDVKG